MASVTIRVDEETKKAASDIVEDFGFDLSSVTRAFYRQIVRERRIPLNLSYEAPNEESREAIRETRGLIERRKRGEKIETYSDVDSMFDAILRDRED